MRLLIHAANLQAGGGLAVAASLLEAWSLLDDELHVLASPKLAALARAGSRTQFHIVDPSPTASLRSLASFRRRAAILDNAVAPDAVLTVFGPPLWRPAAPHVCGFANGLYLWDIPASPGRNSTSSLRHRLRRWQVFRSLRSDADALWVETPLAQAALQARLKSPQPVAVVPNALHAVFEPYRSGPLVPQSPSKEPFQLFFPAAGYPHKNFRLIRALLPLLVPGEVVFDLTLTDAELELHFGALKRHPALVNHGPLPIAALPARYEQAHAVFTPSLLEIASAAWNEAAAMQRPVVSAAIPAARALCGDSALYFAPDSPAEALAAIRRLRDEPGLYRRLVENGGARLAGIPTALDRVHALRRLLLETCRRKPL